VAVRPAVAEDLEQIAAIEQASFSDPWTREAFISALALAHCRFLVAEEDGDGADRAVREGAPRGTGDGGSIRCVLGYVVALVIADEAEIADLAVVATARRRGIGGLLLDRVVAEAAETGVHALFLEVRESNAGALALYQSRGFGRVGRRQAYYRHPIEDALLLKRTLAPS
jgi:ribosomal-protein-alanine N-acetyltransferase